MSEQYTTHRCPRCGDVHMPPSPDLEPQSDLLWQVQRELRLAVLAVERVESRIALLRYPSSDDGVGSQPRGHITRSGEGD